MRVHGTWRFPPRLVPRYGQAGHEPLLWRAHRDERSLQALEKKELPLAVPFRELDTATLAPTNMRAISRPVAANKR